MSELPFETPTTNEEIRSLLLETRMKLAGLWAGFSDELMIQRPGPHPEWSVKDIIAHICWWESFAITRIAVVAAGLKVKSIEDFDLLNRQIDAIITGLPLEAVLAQFDANQSQLLNLVDHFSFPQWSAPDRLNYPGFDLLRLLGANTFGHYFEHIPDLTAFRQKHLG